MNSATQSIDHPVSSLQHRRAAGTVVLGLTLFLMLTAIGIYVVVWVHDHATLTEPATAIVISGHDALWRNSPGQDWRVFSSELTIDEGDEISTELGTVVWVTFFDGSTLEITENSHVAFERLRSSRFSETTQQIRIRIERGVVYGAMATVTASEYGEFEVVASGANILSRQERDRPDNPSTSFVVDVREVAGPGSTPFRAGVFRGAIDVRTDSDSHRLIGPQQIELNYRGVPQVGDKIESEMLFNGRFLNDLAGWEVLYSAEAREPQSQAGVVEVVKLDQNTLETALHIRRNPSPVWARTGVRQTIGRTLRLPSAITLEFDIRIDSQGDTLGGRSTVPIAVELLYTDIIGQERRWTGAYSLRDGEGVIDADVHTTVIPGLWTHIIVDLNNLEPIPKVMETVVVYATGGGYESFVANLSLMTGEDDSIP